GIAEEHEVGKTLLAEPRGKLLAVRALEQVRHVPEFCRLFLQRLDQMRMAVPQRIDRDARGKVEIALAIGRGEPAALAAFEAEIDPGEDGEQMRRGAIGHGDHKRFALKVRPAAEHTRALARTRQRPVLRKRNVPPLKGGTWGVFYVGGGRCQHATKPPFLHCKIKEIRRIAVWWKTRSAMPRCRNMWTRGPGLLRPSHAI